MLRKVVLRRGGLGCRVVIRDGVVDKESCGGGDEIKDVRVGGMFPGNLLTWMEGLDWTDVGIEEGVVMAVFRIVVKVSLVGEPQELKSVGLFDEVASLTASTSDTIFITGHDKPRISWGEK